VLHLGREDAALHGEDARDVIDLVVLALHDDLPIERENGNERDRLRRDGLAQALADELALAEDGDRALLQRRVGGVRTRTARNGYVPFPRGLSES